MIVFSEVQYCQVPQNVIFEWVRDVGAYENSIPGCLRSGIIQQEDDDAEKAYLYVGLGPFKEKIVTRNTYDPPYQIEMELVEGPFKSFHGSWRFTPLDDLTTKVELNVVAEFKNSMIEKLVDWCYVGYRNLMIDFILKKISTYHSAEMSTEEPIQSSNHSHFNKNRVSTTSAS